MILQPHPIIHFESFKAFNNLIHFTTTRHGGYSDGTFGSFNLSYHSGDIGEHVDANRQILCDMFGINPDMMFVPYQVHQTGVAILEPEFPEMGKERQVAMLYGKDALLTSVQNICIAVSTADCVPVLLYATDKKVLGAIHAGWRGTNQRIVQKVIRLMINYYGCSPGEIHAAIGPSISLDAFEVGNEVYRSFRDSGFNMDTIAFIQPNTGRYHINLWEANRQQLLELDIPQHQIELAGICTWQYPDIFFSARRLGIRSGRMLTGICLV